MTSIRSKGLLGSIERLTGLSSNAILASIDPGSWETLKNASNTLHGQTKRISLANGEITTTASLRETARKSGGSFRLRGQNFNYLTPAPIPQLHKKIEPWTNFYPEGPVLYAAFGKDDKNRKTIYFGVTTRGMYQRHKEHSTGGQDRRYGFNVEFYLCWELPSGWHTGRNNHGAVAMAEMMLIYSANKTLWQFSETFWLNNKHYVGKLYGVSDTLSNDVMEFLAASVYPVLDSEIGISLIQEPAPTGDERLRRYASGAQYQGGVNWARSRAMGVGWPVQ